MNFKPPLPSQIADRRLWQIQPIRDLVGFVLVGLTIWFIFDLRRFFAPVFIAFALAYLVEPVVEAVKSKIGLPRWVPALLFTVALVVGTALLITWVGPLLAEQVTTLSSKVPGYVSTLEARYGFHLGSLNDHLMSFAQGIKENPTETLSPVFTGTSQAVGLLGMIVATTLEVLLSTLLVPIFFFLFVWHFDRIRGTVRSVIPERHGIRTRRILHRMNEAVSGFIRGRLLIAAITAVGFASGWTWTDVPYSLLLGLVTGILTIVPYLSLVGWPIALFVKYLDVVSSAGTPDWFDVIVWPSIVFILVAFLEGWVLTPWIQSRTMEMGALTVLLAVLIGGAIGGVLGLLIAIPFTACAQILLEELGGRGREGRLEADEPYG
ncbi:MAG TPA: AI-2E family transporter [Nitrospiraceae bacterium]|nr:AI-2E family transporter [Nitrospiraceae bacterium]